MSGKAGSTALLTLVKQDRLLDAGALLDTEGFALFEREGPEAIAHALQALGVTAETSSARVLALKGLLESLSGRADTAEAWFRLAIARAESDEVKAEVTYRFALDLLRSDRFGAIELLVPLANDPALPNRLLAPINATIAQTHARNGDLPAAARFLGSALEVLAAVEDAHVIAGVQQQVAWVYLQCGELDQAYTYACSSATLAEQLGLHDVLMRASTVLYTIAGEREDFGQSLSHLEKIRMCALKTKNREMEKYALIGSCDIQTQRGDTDALVGIDTALAAFDIRYDADATKGLLPSQALRSAWRGDFTHAYRLLQTTIERQRGEDRQALRAAEVALFAAAMLDPNAGDAIETALQKLLETNQESWRTARARSLTALACVLRGELQAARGLLEQIDPGQRAGMVALKEAIAQTIERFAGAQNHDAFDAACANLRARDYGGYVRLLEALPIASAMQSRFSRLSEHEIAVLRSYLRGAALTESEETALCAKMQCKEPAHVLTLAMRYSPYPVSAVAP